MGDQSLDALARTRRGAVKMRLNQIGLGQANSTTKAARRNGNFASLCFGCCSPAIDTLAPSSKLSGFILYRAQFRNRAQRPGTEFCNQTSILNLGEASSGADEADEHAVIQCVRLDFASVGQMANRREFAILLREALLEVSNAQNGL